MTINAHRRTLLGLLVLSLVGLALCFRHKTEPHLTVLTWQAPRPKKGVTVVGYNVYRAVEGGPFVKIADRVSGPPYEDRIVNSGRTYSYVVTTVDQLGRESRFSAQTSAEIP